MSESDKPSKQPMFGHLLPPNPHPPGTITKQTPKKRRRKKGPQPFPPPEWDVAKDD